MEFSRIRVALASLAVVFAWCASELRAQTADVPEGPVDRVSAFLQQRMAASALGADGDALAPRTWIDAYYASHALLAAQAAGVAIDQSSVQQAANRISTLEETSTFATVTKILVGRLAGRSVGGLRTQLVQAQNGDGGWGIASGKQSNPLDTAIALDALLQPPGLQVDPAVVIAGVHYLAGTQVPQGPSTAGSWPSTNERDRSDVARVARCLHALLSARPHLPDTDLVGASAEYLAKGFLSGLLGSSNIDDFDRSLATHGLIRFGALPSAPGSGQASASAVTDSLSALLSRQRPDGGWVAKDYSATPPASSSEIPCSAAMLELLLAVAPVRRNQPDLALSGEHIRIVDVGGTIQLQVSVLNASTVAAQSSGPSGDARLRVFRVNSAGVVDAEPILWVASDILVIDSLGPMSLRTGYLAVAQGTFGNLCDNGRLRLRFVLDPGSIPDERASNNVLDLDWACDASWTTQPTTPRNGGLQIHPATPAISSWNLDDVPAVELSTVVVNESDSASANVELVLSASRCTDCNGNPCQCSPTQNNVIASLGLGTLSARESRRTIVLWRPRAADMAEGKICVRAQVRPVGSTTGACRSKMFNFASSEVDVTVAPPSTPDPIHGLPDQYYASTINDHTPSVFSVSINTNASNVPSTPGESVQFRHYLTIRRPSGAIVDRAVSGLTDRRSFGKSYGEELFAYTLEPGLYVIAGDIGRYITPPRNPNLPSDLQPQGQEIPLPGKEVQVRVGKSREVSGVWVYFTTDSNGQRRAHVAVGTRGNVNFDVQVELKGFREGVSGAPDVLLFTEDLGTQTVPRSRQHSFTLHSSRLLPLDEGNYRLEATAVVRLASGDLEVLGVRPLGGSQASPARYSIVTASNYRIMKTMSSVPPGVSTRELPVRDGEPVKVDITITKTSP